MISGRGTSSLTELPFKSDDLDSAKTFLRRELGIEFTEAREKDIIKAMKTPDKWLSEKQLAREKIVEDAALLYNLKSHHGFTKFGLSPQQAHDYGMEYARRLYALEERDDQMFRAGEGPLERIAKYRGDRLAANYAALEESGLVSHRKK